MTRILFRILLLICFCIPASAQIQISQWQLDLDSGFLSFEIAGLSTVDITGLDCTKLHLLGSRAAVGVTVVDVQLTGCESAISFYTQFSFQLLNGDLDNLKISSCIATQLSNTYLSVDSGNGVTNGTNELQAYSQQEAVQASLYTPDTTAPTIRSFDLDLNSHTLSLTWDEPTLPVSFQFCKILINNNTASTAAAYRFTGGVLLTPTHIGSVTTLFLLNELDIIQLKSSSSLATTTVNTMLLADSGAIYDTSNVPSLRIPLSTSLQVTLLTADFTPPQLIAFDLDLNAGQLFLTFSDAVSAASFRGDALTLQSSPASVAGRYVTLSRDGTYPSPATDGFVLVVTLSPSDLNRLKQNEFVGNRNTDTFLRLSASLVDDLYGVDVIAITDGQALRVNSSFPDSTRPNILFYSLDLNAGILLISFDEAVDANSLSASSIVLFSSTDSVRLSTPASIQTQNADSIMSLLLSQQDTDAIKLISTSNADTFLNATSTAIRDTSGIPLTPIYNLSPIDLSSDATGLASIIHSYYLVLLFLLFTLC